MKSVFMVLLLIIALNANIIDGIALKVDGNIITLYEIQLMQKQMKKDREYVIDALITDRLRENEIKRLNIKVTDKALNEELESIALNNKITLKVLQESVESNGIKFEDYKKQLKEHMLNRELIQKILQTSSNIASDSDLKKYFNANKAKFSMPTSIKVTSYTSNSDIELQKILANPLMVNKNINMKDEVIDVENLPPQLVNVFISTPRGSFTPVLNSGNTLIVFFIKEKVGNKIPEFDDIKDNVIQMYAADKEKEILKEYFDKKKLSTKIEYIRNN